MTVKKRACFLIVYGALGIAAGVIVLFAWDMVFNSGGFIAHSIHATNPGCGGACHG